MPHLTSFPWGDIGMGTQKKLLCSACIPRALVMSLPMGAPGAHQPCQEAIMDSALPWQAAWCRSVAGHTEHLARSPTALNSCCGGCCLAEVDSEQGAGAGGWKRLHKMGRISY